MEIEIVEMCENDLKEVLDIENTSFLLPWTIDSFKYELNDNPYSNCLVIKADKLILGFVVFWITFDSATLCQIAIDNKYRHLGFGKALMNEMIDICYSKRVTNVTLEVRKSNLSAINLYKKCGFENVTIKQHYYDDGEDAIYMIRKVDII